MGDGTLSRVASCEMSGYGDFEPAGGGGQMTQAQQQDLQKFVQQTQQQAAVMQQIEKFTDMCFKKCVSKPGSSLSSYESECVKHCMKRYIDSKRLIYERIQQQAQQQG